MKKILFLLLFFPANVVFPLENRSKLQYSYGAYSYPYLLVPQTELAFTTQPLLFEKILFRFRWHAFDSHYPLLSKASVELSADAEMLLPVKPEWLGLSAGAGLCAFLQLEYPEAFPSALSPMLTFRARAEYRNWFAEVPLMLRFYNDGFQPQFWVNFGYGFESGFEVFLSFENRIAVFYDFSDVEYRDYLSFGIGYRFGGEK